MDQRLCNLCGLKWPLEQFCRGETYCQSCSKQYSITRRRHLASKGLTLEQYNKILEEQDWGCAICGKQETGGRSLAVDHCHETENVRGLLCFKCNVGIGLFDDDPESLLKAIAYLLKHKKQDRFEIDSSK